MQDQKPIRVIENHLCQVNSGKRYLVYVKDEKFERYRPIDRNGTAVPRLASAWLFNIESVLNWLRIFRHKNIPTKVRKEDSQLFKIDLGE